MKAAGGVRGAARVAALVAAVLLLQASASLAQGLGDASARERERRQKQKPAPVKVITNADLPASASEPAGPKATGSTVSADGAKGAGAGDPGLDELERERQERTTLELKWRERFAHAREAVARADARAWREVVRTEFYNGIPVQMRVKEHVETEELVQSRKALVDLEEEFRRTGLPPGWAREP